MGNFTLIDYRAEVKAELNDITIEWLYETASEVASHAKRNCQMAKEGDSVGYQLRDSYAYEVDDGAGVAQIGTPLEAGYWEEFGTGEHAAHGGGRKGWWVYVKGYQGDGGKTYQSMEEARAAAAFLRSQGLDAYYTNGRKPSYTLEKAFKAVVSKAIEALKVKLKGRLGK